MVVDNPWVEMGKWKVLELQLNKDMNKLHMMMLLLKNLTRYNDISWKYGN